MRKFVKTFENFISNDSNTLYVLYTEYAVAAYKSNRKISLEDLSQLLSKKIFDSDIEKVKYMDGLEIGLRSEDPVLYRKFTEHIPYKVYFTYYDESEVLFDESKDDIELTESGMESYEFYSLEVLEAFCEGIDDTDGIVDLCTFSELEFQAYLKIYTPEEQEQILKSLK